MNEQMKGKDSDKQDDFIEVNLDNNSINSV